METKINQIKDDILSVVYKGKKIDINITKELSIDENLIDSQLKNQPSNYAFLSLLRDDYIKKRDKLEAEKDYQYSNIWLYYKTSDNRLNNDTVHNKVITNIKYQDILSRYQKVSDKANKLISICRAYETRERILQTISANLRKQQ
jgi:hypothetical protein